LVSGAQKNDVTPPTSDTAPMMISTAGVPSADWTVGSRNVPSAAAARLAAVATPTPDPRSELGKISSG
jgi:hypothetical protein